MKTCACCGEIAADSAEACASCGQASWIHAETDKAPVEPERQPERHDRRKGPR
jgi:hypothetical protein